MQQVVVWWPTVPERRPSSDLPTGAGVGVEGHACVVTYVRWAGPGPARTSEADGTHRLWEWSGGPQPFPGRDGVDRRRHVDILLYLG